MAVALVAREILKSRSNDPSAPEGHASVVLEGRVTRHVELLPSSLRVARRNGRIVTTLRSSDGWGNNHAEVVLALWRTLVRC